MVKKPSSTPSPEFDREREFTIVLERLESQFEIFSEDLSSVKKTVNILNKEMGRQREEILFIKTDIRFIKDDVKDLKEGQKRLEGRMTGLETGIHDLNTKFDGSIPNLNNRLTRLESAGNKS